MLEAADSQNQRDVPWFFSSMAKKSQLVLLIKDGYYLWDICRMRQDQWTKSIWQRSHAYITHHLLSQSGRVSSDPYSIESSKWKRRRWLVIGVCKFGQWIERWFEIVPIAPRNKYYWLLVQKLYAFVRCTLLVLFWQVFSQLCTWDVHSKLIFGQ